MVRLMSRMMLFMVACGLAGCATSEDVTDIHPFSSTLLQTCVTAWPVYLYDEDRKNGYHLFDSKYSYGIEPNVVVAEPEVTLPAGTTLTVKRVNLVTSMAGGPSIYISGT